MDQLLRDALARLEAHSKDLRVSEGLHLQMDASKKPLLAQLTLAETGKSMAEREAKACASKDWRDFYKGMVQAECDYNYQKRRYSILENAFYAELATYKSELKMITKQVGP